MNKEQKPLSYWENNKNSMYKRARTFSSRCSIMGIEDSNAYVCGSYKNGMSCNEIQEHLLKHYNISVSTRHLNDIVKAEGITRDYSDRKRNAIKRGRMVYHKKNEMEKYKRKSLSFKIRMRALERDKFKCCLCGGSPETGYVLELHHLNGPENDLENLQTLCFACHRGVHENLMN
jgi:5-methylcytosine-specific restriction endonuclease McrA